MNKIILDGTIWGIQDSHIIGDVQYQKANLSYHGQSGNDNVITLQFKKFQCKYKDGDKVFLSGNVRSHSEQVGDKNKVSIYVFTYFDFPEQEELQGFKNQFLIDGRLCKIEPIRVLDNDKTLIHFTLANNIITNGKKLNSYLPCIAWGQVAKRIEKLNKNDFIFAIGELKSREYKKPLDNGQFEIRVAHELLVADFKELKNEKQL